MTPEEIVSSYDAAYARLGISSPEPPPFRRLVDFLLAPFGRDSRTYARAERTRLLDDAARRHVADQLVREGIAPETARTRVDAALAAR